MAAVIESPGELRSLAIERLDLDEKSLTWQCGQAVRNYDPCISCATHFPRLRLEREEQPCRS